MKGKQMIGLLTIIIIVFSTFLGLGVKSANAETTIQFLESQITSNTASQENPDIYQYDYNWWTVVYQDNRNGHWDIYLYSQRYLQNSNWDVEWDTPITANSGNNINPKIYKDIIVYQSDRNQNWDIYMYNLTSKVETQITTNTANQISPRISGDIIIWQDYRNMWMFSQYVDAYPGMDIYMFNMTSQTEKSLPLPEEACFSPSISGDYLVYIGEDYWDSGYGIFYDPYISGYNLSTGVKSTLVVGETDSVPYYRHRELSSPTIEGSLLAWTVYTNFGAWDVVVKNLTANTVWGSGYGDQWGSSDISKTFVVYQGTTDGSSDIFLHDFRKNLQVDLTVNTANQLNPIISTGYANFVVYMDNRNGNWDIYLTAFWYGTMGGPDSIPDRPIIPSVIINNLQFTRDRITDLSTNEFTGTNDKVKENRRNAMTNKIDSVISTIEAAANTGDLTDRSRGFQDAIYQLNDLIAKIDRKSGSGFTPDWVIATVYIDGVVISCRNNLQTLLDGMS